MESLNHNNGKYFGSGLKVLLLALLWACLGQPGDVLGQCNPAGNPTRWEYTFTPSSTINILGQTFCTSQQQSNGCCGGPSYRCLDLIFHVENGPNGETFNSSCKGQLNLMTAQGNFDALFFSAGVPSAGGNNVSCAAPITIGNNYDISVVFNGTITGEVSANLLVFNSMGMMVFSSLQTVSPGQALILTLCKPGFGCVMDEIAFGCCNAGATLGLHFGAPDTICQGQSATLKVAGLNGVPPYQVHVRAASAADTTYFTITVPSDGDGAPARDTLLVPVSPLRTTTYCAISVEDATGCVQPIAANHKATVVVLPKPTVSAGPDQVICHNQSATLTATVGNGVSSGSWSGGAGTFSNPNGLTTTYTPTPSEVGKTVTLTFTTDDPPGPCPPVSAQVNVTVLQPSPLTCNDKVIVALDPMGMAVIEPDMLLEAPQPNGKYLVEVFVNGVNIGNKVDCSHIGKNVIGRVTDLCTGIRCSTNIMVMDNLPPKLTCTDLTLVCAVMNYTPAALEALGIPNVYPQVEENCGPVQLTYSDIWQDFPCSAPCIGQVVRTWTATDPQGRKASCTQYICFENRGLADVRIPANVTLECTAGVPDTSIQHTGMPFITAYGVDFPIFPPSKAGSCRLSVTYADKVFPICTGSYNIVREWTVLDWCSPIVQNGPNANPRTFSQLISVLDQAGPAILNCPDDLTVSTDPLDCCARATLPSVLLRDVCAGARTVTAIISVRHPVTGDVINTIEVPATLTTPPGNNPPTTDRLAVFAQTPCLPIGAHTVLYHAEDNCNNTSTCAFSLAVQDLMPPQVACIEVTQVALGISGMALVNASSFDNGSYDACGPVYFKARRAEANPCQPNGLFFDQVKFCCEDIGDTIELILRVYDAQPPTGPVSPDLVVGNYSECTVQVYIEDQLRPACVPPANTTVSCENFDPTLWAYGMATGTDNCCVDTIITLANYGQFDTLCSRGTITRLFRVVDCSGNTQTCSQRIVVNYQSSFFVRFPNDLILIECNSPFDNFGQPEFFGVDCESIGVSFEDKRFNIVPDACFKIERTWTIINWCSYNSNAGCIIVPNPNPNPQSEHPSNLIGPTVSPMGTPAPWAPTNARITPSDPLPTNFSTFWSPNPNCYKYTQIIKVRDKQVPDVQCPTAPVEACDQTSNDPQLWNAPHWYDPLIGTHDLCEGPVDLCISASDACSGPADLKVRFLLFLDLDNDGTMETVVSSTNPPPPGTVLFNNANTPNYAGGTLRAFDHRNVPDARKYRFAIETNVAGQNRVACLRWNTLENPSAYTLPELPYGTHKIKWFVEDGCGNEQACEYTFTVKDCKAPTVVCRNGISANLMPTKMISLDYTDLLLNASDNCTPPNLLIFGMRRSGSGFPFLPDGNPQTSVTFDCNDLGYNLVEIWAMDLAGNTDRCTTFVHIQDNIGAFSNANAAVAGTIQTTSGQGLEDATIQLLISTTQGTAEISTLTEPDGYYFLPNALPSQADVIVKPSKNNDHLNGVSTFDLVLINRHILGFEPLSDPYRMIAADANDSRSITTYDILELRKLILGLYAELPANTSWRFIDQNYHFPDPTNPFKEKFPEVRIINNADDPRLFEDFVAVKVGDVNGNAITNSLNPTTERTVGTLYFDTEDRPVRQGETFTVRLQPAEAVAAYQMTLNHPGLQLLDIQPDPAMGLEHFGVHPAEQALTVSYDAPNTTAGFNLIFRANTDGQLRHMLQVSNRITKAEAYRTAEILDIALRFPNSTAPISGVGFELYQNRPNPWTQYTHISFHLPTDEPATLTIYDETGRVRLRHTASYERGYHTLSLHNESIGIGSGTLFYRLETPSHSAVRRMLKM